MVNLRDRFNDINVGIDIIALKRLSAILERSGSRFTQRVFTSREMEEARSHGNYLAALAGSFAAKEAIIKGLCLSPQEELPLKDIQITRGPWGEPRPELSGQAAEIARSRGIEIIKISLSWEEEYAVAVALILGGGGE